MAKLAIHPDNTDQAEQDGRDAKRAGKPVGSNPFEWMVAPKLYDAWLFGWSAQRAMKPVMLVGSAEARRG